MSRDGVRRFRGEPRLLRMLSEEGGMDLHGRDLDGKIRRCARRRKDIPRIMREARRKLLEMRQLAAEAGPAEPDAVPTARSARRAGPPSAAAMHASVAQQRQQISWEIWNADQVPAPFAAPSGLDKRMATLYPTIRAGVDKIDLARHLN